MAANVDPARLLWESYPHHFSCPVLFGDMDGLRHVNNGATARILEEGRASVHRELFGAGIFLDPADGVQLLFARVATDYLRQAYYPGQIDVGTAIERVGRSSWTLIQGAFQEGQCFALSEAVTVKAVDGKSSPLADADRVRMAAFSFQGG